MPAASATASAGLSVRCGSSYSYHSYHINDLAGGPGYNSLRILRGSDAMDLPLNNFKRAITSGKTLFGAWLMSAAPSTAEALGCVGFDFLVVDMEHTPIDTPQMIGILQAIAGTPAQAIVRPPWNDMVMVKRAMDAGAQTLLFPFVQNADEAKRAVASTRYPPDGVRGVAGTHRGSRYGTIPNYLKRAHEEICVIVQI